VRRKALLARLGGVEETAYLELDGQRIMSVAEADVDRTTADGKASSVQFLHFPFTDAQAAAFKQAGTRVLIGFAHPNYAHMAVMPEDMRAALAEDLD
jgi:class 3 adenylate cyclase